LEQERELVVVEVNDDPAAIAECGAEARAEGERLMCLRCENADLSIAAILILGARGQVRWPLCEKCLSEMPAGSWLS
jgi:hypothetical protein